MGDVCIQATPCEWFHTVIVLLDRVMEQRKMLLSMYEAIHDTWIAEAGDCNSSYEDFRWAWFVGMYQYIYIQHFVYI